MPGLQLGDGLKPAFVIGSASQKVDEIAGQIGQAGRARRIRHDPALVAIEPPARPSRERDESVELRLDDDRRPVLGTLELDVRE
jgi:hypothetical protein